MPEFIYAVVVTIALGASSALAEEAAPEAVETVTCVETRQFHDGDTFTCQTEQHGRPSIVVRLAGVDAPERGQPYWKRAREELTRLAPTGATLACHKTDRYERKVCRVNSPGGQDVGLALVRAGLAWHYGAYAAEQAPVERQAYLHAQEAAQEERAGLWAEPSPVPPWDCRKVRRNGGRC